MSIPNVAWITTSLIFMLIVLGVGYRGTGQIGLGKSVMYGLYAITNFIWTISVFIQRHWLFNSNLSIGILSVILRMRLEEHADPCWDHSKMAFQLEVSMLVSYCSLFLVPRNLCPLYWLNQTRNYKSDSSH